MTTPTKLETTIMIVLVSVIAAALVAILVSTRPSDVLLEVRELRKELSTEIERRTEDRFRGAEHREFVEALLKANPGLERPEE